jgi:hypothetical protein
MGGLMLFFGAWLLSFGILIVPKNGKAFYTFFLSVGTAILSSSWAIRALMDHKAESLNLVLSSVSA